MHVIRKLVFWYAVVPRFADRRCVWLSMLETGRQRSARYPRAMLCYYKPMTDQTDRTSRPSRQRYNLAYTTANDYVGVGFRCNTASPISIWFILHKHRLISLTLSHRQRVSHHHHDFGLAPVSAMNNRAHDSSPDNDSTFICCCMRRPRETVCHRHSNKILSNSWVLYHQFRLSKTSDILTFYLRF